MTESAEHEALKEAYRRLRAVAQQVVDASAYPASGESQSRVYRSQVRALERELRGEPAPSGLTFMSVS